ncbi:MAG: threonine--tRNA ligase [Alphaproteobacteria bacterium]|nr:MAG: threonine--tRNA ligase [Alphaproteobacteria bacterium]
MSSQVHITLPDSTVRSFPRAVTGHDIAASISAGLGKKAVLMEVDGVLCDLTRPLLQNARVRIVTRTDPEALEVIRHDAAHMLAQAVKELYPETQITIGPAIAEGFYYDIYRKEPLSSDDLLAIEARMHELVQADIPIVREAWSRDDAVVFFKSIGEKFKAEIIEDIPADQVITLYRQGSFIDLCRGPHLPSTRHVGRAFKLMKIAGAYWRGDAKNTMLQRIYGTAWAEEAHLKAYLHRLEEAEKRDHRKLAKDLDLFHLQEEAAGSVFWHPKGWTIYRLLETFMRTRLEEQGYVEVKTPQLVDRSLWEASGHWEKFGENMFVVEAADNRTLAIKPMNCPCHVQIFRQGIKSYRDLPIRMAEFGSCHRYEPSGALQGIMRVRAFTQDDAHIFCTPEQITAETKSFCHLLLGIYRDFGFDEVMVKFSDRPEKRAGSDAVWDQAENALKTASTEAGLTYVLNPGEGAFYGPKLEFVLKDAIGREWQCGTLQVDFVLPERLQASYIDEEGNKQRPVMLHRAIFGSFERFIGILIEHYAGKFPLWLSPTQVVVAPITDAFNQYASELIADLRAKGFRASADLRNEKISYKIRELSNQKIPLILVVGKREYDDRSVAVRTLGSQNQQVMTVVDFVATYKPQITMPESENIKK